MIFQLQLANSSTAPLNGPTMVFPDRLPPSYEHISHNGIYLLDTGALVLLYVGSAAHPQTLKGLFGIDAHTELEDYVKNLLIKLICSLFLTVIAN